AQGHDQRLQDDPERRMRFAARAGVLHGRRHRGSVREGQVIAMRSETRDQRTCVSDRQSLVPSLQSPGSKMASTIHIDVVSSEESIYSGEAEFVVLPGEAGELGI